MILIDSNLLIYAARPEYDALRHWLSIQNCAVSLASNIEVLGYHKLTATDKYRFEKMFTILRILPVSNLIAETAIRLRQHRKMSLGDAIIAAIALEWHITIATHNTDDFVWIDGLVVIDPLTNGL